MASVLKRLHNFKSSQYQGATGACGEKRSPSPPPSVLPDTADKTQEDRTGEKGVPETDCPLTNDLLHRRKVSISKSGRYKENHKKRCALLDNTQRDGSPVKTLVSESLSLCKDDQRTAGSVKDKEEKNKENEQNKENIIVRRDSIISDTDGHAVADEIESLAKTLTIENSIETAL